MSRFKPSKKLDVIGSLALSPEKAPGTFNESVLQNKFFVKVPKWDSAGDSVELWALQNEREYNEMLKLQEEMLDNGHRQTIINSSRIEELSKMQHFLRNRFIESNNFFKDCDDKKKFAEKKVSEEKQIHSEFKNSIATDKSNIRFLSEFRDILKKTVEKYEPYETVIDEVIRNENIFSSVKDCIDRCDALMMAQVEVVNLKKEKLDKIENLQLQMVKMTNEAALTVLGLNNQLAELERSYVHARSECLKWEKILVNIKDCILGNILDKNRMYDEIQILYRRLCKRRGVNPVLKKTDFEGQLNFIRDEIRILQEVYKECTKK